MAQEMDSILHCRFCFLVDDARLSSGHPAYGMCGHSDPENMYSMNWETYSFMRMRHVPVLGTLWGGQIVATVHVMQRCWLDSILHCRFTTLNPSW